MIFASGGHSGRIVLLTDVDHEIPEDRRYEVVKINDWYDPTHFDGFRANASLDSSAMGGFWFHVVERFFVLHQFMEREGLHSLFHAELDVLVINLDGVSEACDAHGSGIFAVMDDPTRALASLFYVNSSTKFSHFLGFAADDLSMKNEMAMIAAYLQMFPENGHALPSSPFFEPGQPQLAPSAVPDEIGLFDAAAFGQWLFGVDTKLVKYASRNHFRNETVRFPIEQLKFTATLLDRRFEVSSPWRGARSLRTLHIHSKIIGRLRFRPAILFYFIIARLSRSFVVTRRPGWWAGRLLDAIFANRIWNVLKHFAGGEGTSLTKAILALSKKTVLQMPNRHRLLLTNRLPWAPLGKGKTGANEVWLIAGRATQDSVKEAISEALAAGPFSRVRVISDGSFSTRRETASHSNGATEMFTQDGDPVVLAGVIFESTVNAILVVDSTRKDNLDRIFFDTKGRQLAVVSSTKDDRAISSLRSSKEFHNLRQELAFSSEAIGIRPDVFREIFNGSRERAEEWARASQTAYFWSNLAQLYGAWIWTNRRPSVRLAKGSSPYCFTA